MSSPACILLTHYLLTLEMASQFAKDRDENSELVLVPTYECIRDLMLGSLSRDVPGRTRITIEKEVRQVVMLIYLSAYGIQPIRQSGRVTRRASSDYVTDRFALPVRSRMTPPSSPPVRPFQRLPQSPQDVYRTPPPSQHTSSQTLPSINHLGSDAEDYSPYDGLRRLADISAKHLWSASSDTMLESWIIGEHPSEMDADYMLSRLKNKDTDETPRRKRQAHRPSSQHMMGSAFPGSSQSEAQIRRPQLEDPMPSSSQLLPLMTAPNIISSSQGEKSRKTPKKKKKKRRLEGF